MMILVAYFFLHAHREAYTLANEISEESDQFRFLRAACLTNLKGSVGLILAKVSDMRISIPRDLVLLYHCLVSFVLDAPHRFESLP